MKSKFNPLLFLRIILKEVLFIVLCIAAILLVVQLGLTYPAMIVIGAILFLFLIFLTYCVEEYKFERREEEMKGERK